MVHGANLAVSAPRAGHVVDRLRSLDLLVVCDFLLSETAAMADVVLPVLQWAEEEGTMTSLEGRVLRRRRGVEPPDGARGELEVLRGLAVRLGQPAHRFPVEPREVFDELRAASAGGGADYAGVTYDRLDAGEVLHWPCPDVGHPGTPRLFLDRFGTDDGRARFTAVEHRGSGRSAGRGLPTGRDHGTCSRALSIRRADPRVAELASAAGSMFVQVHPDTAARAGVRDGDDALVVGRRGRVSVTVRCDDSMRLDTVFLPFHFAGDARANLLTNRHSIRRAGCGVQGVRGAVGAGPGGGPVSRVVIVGNGMAGARLAESCGGANATRPGSGSWCSVRSRGPRTTGSCFRTCWRAASPRATPGCGPTTGGSATTSTSAPGCG